MNKVLEALFVFALSVAVWLYRIFVITKVWSLIAPVLKVEPLSDWKQAYAIVMIASVAAYQHVPTDKPGERTIERILGVAISLSLSWFVAWVVFG